MNQALKFLFLFAGAVVLLIVGGSIGWFRTTPVTTQLTPSPSRQGSESPTLARSDPDARTTAPIRPRPRRAPASASNTTHAMPTEALAAHWEEHLDAVLASEQTDDRGKAQELLAVFPLLPAEGQTACAQHLSNLVTDQDYGPLGRLLTNSTLPDEVLETLMSDVLNRANTVKLPALMAVARDPQHPKAAEAHDILELTLDQDFGQDWATWETRLQEWLTANPDVEPEQQMQMQEQPEPQPPQ
jgi:hypothetical protein